MIQLICERLAETWAKCDTWFIFGLVGQVLFTCRFLYQWIVSERRKESIIPLGFWYLSISGSLTLFIYGVGRAEPILVLGQSVNTLIYTRNLMFIHRKKVAEADKEQTSDSPGKNAH